MKLEDYTLSNWKSRKIKRKKIIGGKTILLLSLSGMSSKEGSKNLLAIDENENILWKADLPTEMYDSYVDMTYQNRIIRAESSNSFVSEINPETGKIIRKYMVK